MRGAALTAFLWWLNGRFESLIGPRRRLYRRRGVRRTSVDAPLSPKLRYLMLTERQEVLEARMAQVKCGLSREKKKIAWDKTRGRRRAE